MKWSAGSAGRGRRVGAALALAAAAGAAVVGLGRPGAAQVAGPTGKPIRVVVVNVKQVTDTCARTQDLRTALEKQREAKLEAVRALRDQLQRAQNDLKVLVKNTPAWRDQNAKVIRLDTEVRILSEMSVKELQAVNVEYAARVHEAVMKEVEAYAKANAIDLVLRAGETETEAESATPEELYRKMAQGVLYAAAALDVTEDVRRAADRTYQAEKRGTP